MGSRLDGAAELLLLFFYLPTIVGSALAWFGVNKVKLPPKRLLLISLVSLIAVCLFLIPSLSSFGQALGRSRAPLVEAVGFSLGSASFVALPPLMFLVVWRGIKRKEIQRSSLSLAAFALGWLMLFTYLAGLPWQEEVAYNYRTWAFANAIVASMLVSLGAMFIVAMGMIKNRLPLRRTALAIFFVGCFVASVLLVSPTFTQAGDQGGTDNPDVEFYFVLQSAENGTDLTIYPVKIETSWLMFRVRDQENYSTVAEFTVSGPFPENEQTVYSISENLQENKWYSINVYFGDGGTCGYTRLGENTYMRYTPFVCGTGLALAGAIKSTGEAFFVYVLLITSTIVGVVAVLSHKRGW